MSTVSWDDTAGRSQSRESSAEDQHAGGLTGNARAAGIGGSWL